MSPALNLLLAVGGTALEGAVFILVIRTVRRTVRPQRREPVRAIATIARPELPPPRRKELIEQ